MKRWINVCMLFALMLVNIGWLTGQEDDLLNLLEEKNKPETEITIATFKATRVVTGHSVECAAKGDMHFLISHRFGQLNSGFSDFYGLDNSTIRLGLDYGITNNINIGLGRSSFLKTYDLFFKWRLLRQKSGASSFPFTATLVSSMYMNSSKYDDDVRNDYFLARLDYHHSLLLARKFGEFVSIQLMPTIVHRNLVTKQEDKNTIFALGAGASLRLTPSIRANAEYYYTFPNQIVSPVGTKLPSNTLSIGLDIETGGHVFQLHLTNSRAMTEKFLVDSTTGQWGKGDIHFGFNISRVFTVAKPKGFE
jgi:hypothetical protein